MVKPVELDSDETAEPSSGPDLIAKYVKTLSGQPGVYRMLDEHDVLLYIGKAKNLKKRVTAYTKYDRHPIRIRRMIRATTSMEFVVTKSETEALLLEASLIKQLKPRYNILLRDDKSFPYILMRKDHPAAQLKKHRGKRSIKGDYYGPFASALACMLHQIKRCAAPCTGEISLEDYAELNRDASDFLTGKSGALRTRLTKQMEGASKDLNFEKAAELRDRLRAMAFVSAGKSSITPNTFKEADVAAIYMDGGQACVQVFFFRAGQNWGNNAYYPRHSKDQPAAEILDAFLAQFYTGKPIPKQTFVNQDLPNKGLLETALSERKGASFKIFKPVERCGRCL